MTKIGSVFHYIKYVLYKVLNFIQHYFKQSNLSPDDDVEHRNLLTETTSFVLFSIESRRE